MKKIQLFMSALLLCGLSVFTSCSDSDDSPAPVQENERAVFEKQFSQDVQDMADEFRFDAISQTASSINEFIDALDEDALAAKLGDLVMGLVGGLQSTKMADLSAGDKVAVTDCLKDRLGITDEEVANMESFVVVDAYNSIGKMKMAFKDGQCTITNDADAFTIENTNSEGQTQTIALKFNDERDGLCFFINVYGNPIAIQLPKSITVTKTTTQGKIFTGTIFLTTFDANQSKYVSFKQHGWMAEGTLSADINNRRESANLYTRHTAAGAFDLKAAFVINGKEMASMEVDDMHDTYTDEEIEEFKELRDMGEFFSASYDVLKALKGKSVDNITITMNNNMVIKGKVNDIAKSLLALGNVRKLYGTKPGKEAIDKYTQELNNYVHFTVGQKNTGITADATLVTAQKNLTNGEYQPVVALKFNGEKEALAMFDRMTDKDKENYKKMFDNISPLIKEISGIIETAKGKVKKIGGAIKSQFGS